MKQIYIKKRLTHKEDENFFNICSSLSAETLTSILLDI